MVNPSDRTPLGPGAEFDLIRRFLEGAAPVGGDVLVGPGDDCAVLRVGQLAISTDVSVEGVHFRRAWLSADEIGGHAAAAALSDLAAMAARPLGLLVSIAAPVEDVPRFAERVMRGVVEAGEGAGAALLGGDVSVSPGPLFLDVVVLGEAPAPVLRSGARVGDDLWVTGTLGAAAAAVEAWRRGQEPPADARAAFARPRPRIREALWLNERGVLHAMLDLSDGLAGDAGHLAAASGVGVVLEPGRVPVAAAARAVAAPGGTAGPGPASAGAQSAAATGTRPPGAARPSSKAGASPTGAQPAAARTGPSAAARTGAPAATSPTGVKAPGAPAATDDPALVLALTGGEDYELCFAAGPGAVEPLVEAFAREFGVPLTRVGRIVEGAGVAVQEADGSVRPLSLSGYRHFEEVRGVE